MPRVRITTRRPAAPKRKNTYKPKKSISPQLYKNIQLFLKTKKNTSMFYKYSLHNMMIGLIGIHAPLHGRYAMINGQWTKLNKMKSKLTKEGLIRNIAYYNKNNFKLAK